jgi:hypothetical protein
MTTGYEDFNVPVNISAQRTAHITQRPKYGAAQSLIFDAALTPSGITTLGTVLARGIIYGGYIYISGAAIDDGDIFNLTIDTVLVFTLDWGVIKGAALSKNHSQYLYMINNDTVLNRYTLGFSSDITFESSLVISFEEIAGSSLSAIMNLNYATI